MAAGNEKFALWDFAVAFLGGGMWMVGNSGGSFLPRYWKQPLRIKSEHHDIEEHVHQQNQVPHTDLTRVRAGSNYECYCE